MRKPVRRIEAARFHGQVGVVSINELMALPKDTWGNLRDRITDYRSGSPQGIKCTCLACDHPVFIKVSSLNSRKYPLFSHYAPAPDDCQWRSEETSHPDELRAAQYAGKQESAAHRNICDQIAELCRLDQRCTQATVNEYRAPKVEKSGRYPDVNTSWTSFGDIVFEVQLSNTFQTEISERSLHYAREGARLIWVLYGFDLYKDQLKQSFIDVIRRHRGNAFVLDQQAINESYKQQKLILKCYMKSGDQFDSFELVGLDQLNLKAAGLPFREDRIIPALRQKIDEQRRPCFTYLDTIKGSHVYLTKEGIERRNKLATYLSSLEPELTSSNHLSEVIDLVALVFSAIRFVKGSSDLYGSRQNNITQMLNSSLSGSVLGKYHEIISTLIEETPLKKFIKPSVITHLERARHEHQNGRLYTTEKRLLGKLVPEIFHGPTRQLLADLEELPEWAA